MQPTPGFVLLVRPSLPRNPCSRSGTFWLKKAVLQVSTTVAFPHVHTGVRKGVGGRMVRDGGEWADGWLRVAFEVVHSIGIWRAGLHDQGGGNMQHSRPGARGNMPAPGPMVPRPTPLFYDHVLAPVIKRKSKPGPTSAAAIIKIEAKIKEGFADLRTVHNSV